MPDVIESIDAAGGASTTYTLAIGQTAQGSISTLGDHDWFRVDLVAGQTYTFALVGTGSSGVRDPLLSLLGPDGTTIVASNDDWAQAGTAALQSAFAVTGAFALSDTRSKDAAIVTSLPAGAYTVALSGVAGGTGEGLIEIYEMP